MYAAGKIPGSFFKREGRAGEKGTLTARMIDRPIRPLFPKGWRCETQLVAIPLSVDHVHPYDILAMNGASAALMISDIPFPTPGRRGAHRQDRRQLRRQPARGGRSLENSDLDLVVAGTEEAILMVEAGANEIPEAEILDALDIAHDEIKKLCAAAARAGREGRQGEDGRSRRRRSTRACSTQIQRLARRGARRGHAGRGQARAPGRDQGRRGGGRSSSTPATPSAEDYAERTRRRRSWRSTSSRRRSSASASPSTRSAPTAAPRTRSAPISIEVGVAPRTHGSALFTRGQTQALSRRRARHAEGGDAPRHARARDEEVLLAPLQLPAVLGRGGRLHARPQAPRHRPRRARRARAGADGPVDRGVPVHDPRRLGHPRVQRLVVDGVGLRLVAVADGRGRADQARRSPASRWA